MSFTIYAITETYRKPRTWETFTVRGVADVEEAMLRVERQLLAENLDLASRGRDRRPRCVARYLDNRATGQLVTISDYL